MQGPAAGDLSRSSAATPGGQAGAGSDGATTAAAAEPVSELEADALRQAAAGLLLPFQKAMVEELLEEDGLCVMSPGLGLHQVRAWPRSSTCCFLRASKALRLPCGLEEHLQRHHLLLALTTMI